MTAGQIFLYAFIALIIFYIGKKIYLIKSIKQYSPADAYAKVKKERNVVFLDVRTERERKQSLIKGSYHIPITDLKEKEQELKKFKDAEIICYCQTGNRSLNAASKLRKMGFNATNLSGGMVRWNATGLK
ncbi:MAG: rhodanese-like domain-containing protein [Ignavibacteriota bacterium]|jgi:rhodanese-related sulfurtransferase|nr:rhodanese-like domain-containing protein [Ignavibacterium sp.]MCO6448435.1 rhodanese-like domain-containing protein [Ignavibacterium album]MCZ2270119.1 rhodanese-like domain-containing protein [Ignavibacteriales bacterium]MDX9713643.1 rhodanese-like domain-containing protein [Ignavibacteriaceae bacterium]QKK00566.1 MAG: rhodanese-like domain-containing protein [Ignavibacteriota bacterium]